MLEIVWETMLTSLTWIVGGLSVATLVLLAHIWRQPPDLRFSLTTHSRFSNWSQAVSSSPSSLLTPSSTAQVQDIVLSARASSSRLRVVGGGHSWNASAATEDIMVSLDAMDAIIAVHMLPHSPQAQKYASFPPASAHSAQAVGYVTVQAGIRFAVLQQRLAEEHGLGFHCLPSVAYQSAGGLIATGTHSNGPGFQNQSNYVVEIELVDGKGDVRVISRDPECEDSAFFDAVRLSLGCLGIVTKVTFELVPVYNLTKIEGPVEWDWVLENYDDLVANEEFFKLWTFPGTNKTQVSRFVRTPTSVAPTTGLATWIETVLLQQYVVNAVLWVSSWAPSSIGPVMQIITSILGQRTTVDRSDKLFNIPVLIRHHECEIAFPLDRATEILDDLLATIQASGLPINMPLEIRQVAADGLWLSNNYEMDALHVTACLYNLDPKPYYELFEEFAVKYGGRPHWGKYFSHTARDLASLYPRWSDFQDAMDEFDPHGVFGNAWTDRVFNHQYHHE